MTAMQGPVPQRDRTGPGRTRPRLWRIVAAVEVALAVAAILLDLTGVPTLVLLVLAAVSLAVRRQGFASLGLRRPDYVARMCLAVIGMAVAWVALTFVLIKPLLEHVTGRQEDLSQYAGLEGDLPNLLGLLAVSWTLAAVGEELVYRGFLLTRLREVLPAHAIGTALAAVVAAVLFGWAHREYGAVGVIQVTLDALFFRPAVPVSDVVGGRRRARHGQHGRHRGALPRRARGHAVVSVRADGRGACCCGAQPLRGEEQRPWPAEHLDNLHA